MTRNHRIIISVILVAASAFLAYRFTIGARNQQGADATAPTDQTPEAVLTSPELVHRERGQTSWKVILEELQLDKGGSTVAVNGLREGLIYDDKGEPVLRITAKQVQGDTNRRDFRMSGQVVVTSPKGMVIKTEELVWFNNERTVHCPGTVMMKAKNLVISTTQLDYAVDPDTVTCPNQVRMYSGNNRLVGRSLKYDVKTGIVDILGGIQMVIVPAEAKDVLKEWSSQ